MTKFSLLLMICFLFTLFGCTEESVEPISTDKFNTSCTQVEGDIFSCDTKDAICLGEVRVFNDISGDVQQSFVDLTEMTITSGDDCVEILWTMESLPEVLIIDQTALELNASNYSWSVYFDIDGNGKLSKGDLFIGIDKFKLQDQEEQMVPISELAFGSLGEVESITESGHIEVKAKVFNSGIVSDNSIRLYMPKALNSNLAKITELTPVEFTAQFNDGNKEYIDSYP